MSDEMQIEGKEYISSKRASELSGYAQDYIGQLARKSLIDSRRIGGLWYVSMESLDAYKKKADEYKPEPPTRVEKPEPGTLIFFDGKEYLSAARAAEVTGYAQDYVGQLARTGAILSRQVGNRWYVERHSILDHKSGKDALLAAVQSESVGLVKQKPVAQRNPEYQSNSSYSGLEPALTYFNEGGDLMPVIETRDDSSEIAAAKEQEFSDQKYDSPTAPISVKNIPIRRVQNSPLPRVRPVGAVVSPIRSSRPLTPLLLAAAATIIIVLSVGYASLLKQNSVYAVNIEKISGMNGLPAAADDAFAQIGNILEPLLTHQLTYDRPDSQ